MEKNKRENKSWVKNLLWIDSKNRCPICESILNLPIDNFKKFRNEEFKKIKQKWNKKNQRNNHIGRLGNRKLAFKLGL